MGNEKNINTIEIPEYFKKRFTSENEIFRYEVLPSKDVTINSNLNYSYLINKQQLI